jgi:hypothetical protein
MKRPRFVIETTAEMLHSQSGFALAGTILNNGRLRKRLDMIRPGKRRKGSVPDSDVLISMIALLCHGKSDFEAIEAFQDDSFFKRALGLESVPSEPTLRQRLDGIGLAAESILLKESARLIAQYAPKVTPCWHDYVPIDADVSPFDNSGTKKEGVSCTYKLRDGYAPMFAYLGLEGYLLYAQLREGKQHCQEGTPEFLKEVITRAREVTTKPLLVRMDSGNDSLDNLEICRKQKVDYVIKRNLRKESKEEWLETAQAFGEWEHPREGKEVYRGETFLERENRLYRVIFEVTQRTIKADGQHLLIPEVKVDTYWTSLKASPEEIIELYHQHGTSEQYHSEIKSDMGLERLPSGKFATNALVLLLSMVAYNILRIIGQTALEENDNLPPGQKMPIRKKIKRRRVRKIIQDFMYMAGKVVNHGNRWRIRLADRNPWHAAWNAVYQVLIEPIKAVPG